MFLKRGKKKEETQEVAKKVDSTTPCQNCIRLTQELNTLKEKLAVSESMTKKKNFSIAPTLYTFYRNNVMKNRISRAASQISREVLENMPEENHEEVYEELIEKCKSQPVPIPYFQTEEFAEVFINQCAQIQSPVYVFGDFHGNLPDLLAFARILWPLGMHLAPGSFLFLGDYVDRGQYSLEVLSYLFAQKIMLSDKVFLLRGNHELRAVNGWESFYGMRCFLGQCKARFGVTLGRKVWNAANAVFDCLPFAATIDEAIFCVHGGIPRPLANEEAAHINSINTIPVPAAIRPSDNPSETKELKQLANDLLWADPAQAQQEKHLDKTGFGEGERGPGAICFGNKAVTDFLSKNGLSYVLRAHEPTQKGINISKGGKVITIFSTSRDHGCQDAFCGCILVDGDNIIAINHPDPQKVQEYEDNDSDESMDLEDVNDDEEEDLLL
ncbi:hypothetical protein WA158_006579 [Blastocystis sp. Blastoise]